MFLMRVISSKLSFKMAVFLDTVGTLAIEELGYKFSLHVYDPAMIGAAAIMTYSLFRWKDHVTHSIVNSYYYAKDNIFSTASDICDFTKEKAADVSGSFLKLSDSVNGLESSIKCRMVRRRALKNRNNYKFRPN